ncbi:MAG TPA: hypothetical protein VIS72_12900 [Anaerolineales bacterium]
MVDLLKIKLFVPHTGGILVSRPRLVELLNSRLDKELILIAAPAEFGKITLMITWLEQIDLLAAWRSVDEADNDLPRFLATWRHSSAWWTISTPRRSFAPPISIISSDQGRKYKCTPLLNPNKAI